MRIDYILNNYDNIDFAGRSLAYSYNKPNGKSKPANTIIYSKKINGTYYVVQAVPDTKAKTLYVVTAYISKKGESQLIDAQNLNATPENGSEDSPITTITHSETHVKNTSNNTSNDYKVDDGRHDFADYWGYRTVYFEDYDGAYYQLRFSVAMNSQEDAVYNIGKIRSRPSAGSSAQNTNGAQKVQSASNNNVSQYEPVVKNNLMQNSETNAEISKNNFMSVSKPDKKLSFTETISKNQSDSKREVYDTFSVPIHNRTELNSLLKAAYNTVERGGSVSDRVKSLIYENLLDKNGNIKKHAGFYCSNGFNYYDTQFAIDDSGVIWGGTIIARIDKNKNIYFYDLDNIREVGYMDVKYFNPSGSFATSLNDNNVSQDEPIVKNNLMQNSGKMRK